METPPTALKLLDVTVEGLDEFRAQTATTEITRLVLLVAGSNLDLAHDVRLEIIVSDRMERHVDRISAEHGFVDPLPYNRTKHAVVAAGITLSAPGDPPFRVTIVLHSELWSHDSGEAVALRVYFLGHELGHVLQKGWGSGVQWTSRNDKPRSYSLELKRAAAVLRDEFDADMAAESLCRLSLRDDRGNVVRPGTIFGHRFVDAVGSLLGRLCDFAKEVQLYRITDIGLDALQSSALPLVGELLLVLGHTVALYAGTDDMTPLRKALEKLPGFTEYVHPDLDAFMDSLSREDRAGGELELVRIAESILSRLGLRFEDLPDGSLYVHVHEPVQCAQWDAKDHPS